MKVNIGISCPAYYTGTVNARGAPHGRGSYVLTCNYWHKGDTYTGQFTDGLRHGVGKYTRSGVNDGHAGWYAGEWKANLEEGYGRCHVCVVFVSRSHCSRGFGGMVVVITRGCGRATNGMDLER
jgi:hypothetical protein